MVQTITSGSTPPSNFPALPGAGSAGNPQLAAGENHVGAVGGHSARVTGSFNRPADTTAYAVGDLIANSTVAGNVVPVPLAAARVPNGSGIVSRVGLTTNKPGLAGTEQFRVHLFRLAPGVTVGDNGVLTGAMAGVAAHHLGQFDITMDRVFSDGARGFAAPSVGSTIVFETNGGTMNLYALIEARSAYTPASGETFTITLEVMKD